VFREVRVDCVSEPVSPVYRDTTENFILDGEVMVHAAKELISVNGLRNRAPDVKVESIGLLKVRQRQILRNYVLRPWVQAGLRKYVVGERNAIQWIINMNWGAKRPSGGGINPRSQQDRKVAAAKALIGPESCGYGFLNLAPALVIEGPECLVADERP